jgi:hypothetical protein
MVGEKFHIIVTIENEKILVNHRLLRLPASKKIWRRENKSAFIDLNQDHRAACPGAAFPLAILLSCSPTKEVAVVGFSSAGICADAPRVVDCGFDSFFGI